MARDRKGPRVKGDSGYDELKWLSGRDLSKYQGKWIVVHDRKIVAAARDINQAIEKAKLPPDVVPFVFPVPKEPHLPLGGYAVDIGTTT